MRITFPPLAALVPCAALLACASDPSLEDRSCPCVPGYSCRLADQVCVESPSVQRGDAEPRCTREAPECSQDEATITDSFASADQLEELLVGRWLLCEGAEKANEDPELMGIEFVEGGMFYLLTRNSDGECVRDHGFDREGSWELEDISEQNPPGTYQASMFWAGGGVGAMVPAFSGSPRKMRDGGDPDWWGELIADPQ